MNNATKTKGRTIPPMDNSNNEVISLRFKKLQDNSRLPVYAHEGDSGMDVYSPCALTLEGYSYVKVPLGLACNIPEGYELQVRPRSGLAAKRGIVSAFGTVDQGYRGEIGVTLFNHSAECVRIAEGDRIAQLVLAPVLRARIEETDLLDSTERGVGGFGSTGN